MMLGLVFGQKRAQASDHLACANVITAYVGQNGTQRITQVLIGMQNNLGCFGIAEDRGQGLFDLVRNRGGELACEGEPRRVRSFDQMTLQRPFGQATPPKLNEQRRDQSGLTEYYRQYGCKSARMFAPIRALGEANLATGRQAARVQRPVPQCPRVRNTATRRSEQDAARVNGLACDRCLHLFGNHAAAPRIRFHGAAQNSRTNIGLDRAVNGCARYPADFAQVLLRHVGTAVSVTKLRQVDNDRVCRLRGDSRNQLWRRETGKKFDLGRGNRRQALARQLLASLVDV